MQESAFDYAATDGEWKGMVGTTSRAMELSINIRIPAHMLRRGAVAQRAV